MTSGPSEPYLFYAVLNVNGRARLVDARLKSELQSKINEIEGDVELVAIIKGRKKNFRESKQISLC